MCGKRRYEGSQKYPILENYMNEHNDQGHGVL